MSIERFTLEQFQGALPEIAYPLGLIKGEHCFAIDLAQGVSIMIRSSIDSSGIAADTAEDSIRFIILDAEGNVISEKLNDHTKRVKGWERRVNEMIQYLSGIFMKTGTCKVCGKPLRINQVKKPGPNKGRWFASCRTYSHNNFVWLDLDAIKAEVKNGTSFLDQLEELEEQADENAPISTLNSKPVEVSPPDLSILNEYQLAVVKTHAKGQYVVEACPGSGKTRTIEFLIADMLASGVHPSRIGAFTFSVKGAEEMRVRIARTIWPDISQDELNFFASPRTEIETDLGETYNRDWVEQDPVRMFLVDWVCTIHALSIRLLLESGEKIKVLARPPHTYEVDNLIKDSLKELDWEESPKSVKSYISYAINDLVEPFRSESYFYTRISQICGGGGPVHRAGDLAEIYKRYILYMRKNNLVDFDMMQAEVLKRLRNDPTFRKRAQEKFDYIIVDEAQDTNPMQSEILWTIAKRTGNILFCGDVDQCQPAGTVVSLPRGQKKYIQDLVVGDEVVSFDRHAGRCTGVRNQARKILGISKREYNGNLITVSVDDRKTHCTDGHRWIARFNERSDKLCVTYLMRKGNNFRVGWCQLFKENGTNHLGIRARLEDADDAWILKVHKNRTQASAYESIVAAVYGLPTITFRTIDGAQHLTRETIDFIFDGINQLSPHRDRAIKCLRAHYRNIEYPYYSKSTYQRHGRTTLFEIRACNLIPEIMSVPVYNCSPEVEWKPISIQVKKVNYMTVYGLDVETHGTYVANGIVTHNSMYSFRGAVPEVMRSIFEKEWPEVRRHSLPINYRSTKSIISLAEKLVGFNYQKEEQKKYLKSFLPSHVAIDGIQPKFFVTDKFKPLTEEIVNIIKNDGVPGDWFILSRTRAECSAIHTELIANKIPAINKSGGLLFGAPHVRKVLAYARLGCNYHGARDDLSILREIANVASSSFLAPITRRRHIDGCHNDKPWINCGCPVILEEGKDYSHARYYGEASLSKAGSWAGIVEQQYEKNRGGFPSMASKGAQDLVQFVLKIEKFQDDAQSALRLIIDDCVIPWLAADEGLSTEDLAEDSKLEDFGLLQSMAKNDMTLEQFLEEIETLSAGGNEGNDQESVLLGTFHWSKGAERPKVITNLTRCPIIPPKVKDGMLRVGRPPSTEEERRLAFVGITRAKQELYVVAAQEWNNIELPLSQFITEIQ